MDEITEGASAIRNAALSTQPAPSEPARVALEGGAS